MNVTAIVLCAGRGKRFKRKVSKPLSLLLGKPLFLYSLEVLQKIPQIKKIILVGNKYNIKILERIVRNRRIKKVEKIILGGNRRQDSVENALQKIDSSSELVLIHDGVRPLIRKEDILRLIHYAKKYPAVILGIPLTSTIKLIDCKSRIVKRTLERNNIWEIQTPQIFKTSILKEAYKRFNRITFTDDAALVEKLGEKVKLVEGSCFNIKVTTYQDLKILEALLRSYGLSGWYRL